MRKSRKLSALLSLSLVLTMLAGMLAVGGFSVGASNGTVVVDFDTVRNDSAIAGKLTELDKYFEVYGFGTDETFGSYKLPMVASDQTAVLGPKKVSVAMTNQTEKGNWGGLGNLQGWLGFVNQTANANKGLAEDVKANTLAMTYKEAVEDFKLEVQLFPRYQYAGMQAKHVGVMLGGAKGTIPFVLDSVEVADDAEALAASKKNDKGVYITMGLTGDLIIGGAIADRSTLDAVGQARTANNGAEIFGGLNSDGTWAAEKTRMHHIRLRDARNTDEDHDPAHSLLPVEATFDNNGASSATGKLYEGTETLEPGYRIVIEAKDGMLSVWAPGYEDRKFTIGLSDQFEAGQLSLVSTITAQSGFGDIKLTEYAKEAPTTTAASTTTTTATPTTTTTTTAAPPVVGDKVVFDFDTERNDAQIAAKLAELDKYFEVYGFGTHDTFSSYKLPMVASDQKAVLGPKKVSVAMTNQAEKGNWGGLGNLQGWVGFVNQTANANKGLAEDVKANTLAMTYKNDIKNFKLEVQLFPRYQYGGMQAKHVGIMLGGAKGTIPFLLDSVEVSEDAEAFEASKKNDKGVYITMGLTGDLIIGGAIAERSTLDKWGQERTANNGAEIFGGLTSSGNWSADKTRIHHIRLRDARNTDEDHNPDHSLMPVEATFDNNAAASPTNPLYEGTETLEPGYRLVVEVKNNVLSVWVQGYEDRAFTIGLSDQFEEGQLSLVSTITAQSGFGDIKLTDYGNNVPTVSTTTTTKAPTTTATTTTKAPHTVHTYGDWVVVLEATADEAGEERRDCTECNHFETREIPKLEPAFKAGWNQIDGKWYYLDANGEKVTNKWMKDSKGWVKLGADGAMLTNAWTTDSKGWCFVGADGYAVTNCWKKDSKGWIWLNGEGSMTKSKWIQDGSKWYYLDAAGYMVTNKWQKDSKGWVKLGADGAMLTNKWTTDSKGWCYVGANGYAVTNTWKKDNTGWIYLDKEGSMTKAKWVKDGGKWYYCDGNGYMVAGKSMKIGGKTYNFNASGVCTNP